MPPQSIKQAVRRILNTLGVDVVRYREPPPPPPQNYTAIPPHSYLRYVPWGEDWIQRLYAEVSERTDCTLDRCYNLVRFFESAIALPGHFAECGSYRGGTGLLLARQLARRGIHDREIHLFDSFEGMPKEATQDPSGHVEGDFGDVDFQDVLAALAPYPYVHLHRGFIPHTFDQVDQAMRFAFVHIDVDLYQSAYDCLEYFYSRMVPRGIMLFDNYGFYVYRDSEKRAVDEFFADKVEAPIVLGTSQCLVIKS